MLIDGTKKPQEENTMIGGQPSGNIGGTSTLGQTGSKGPTASGGFTNLNKYIQANQGANNQTINKLNNTAQQSATEAQNAINQAKTVGQTAQQNIDKYKQDQDFVKSSLQSPPTGMANYDRFTNLRTGFNANPTQAQSQFEDASAQANATRTQKANELQNYTTSGGLTDWLRNQRTSPRYSQGSQSLDKFLIKGTNEGAQALQNIGQQAQQLSAEPGDFADIRSGIQSRAQALDPNLMSAEQIQNAANQRIAQERQALIDYQNRTRDAVADGGMKDNNVAGTIMMPDKLGETSGLIDRGGGLGETGQMRNLQNYLAQNDTDALVSRFTPEQIAKYTALARMSGQDPNDVIAANESAYQARNARTNQIASQYQDITEQERQQQMQQMQAQQAAEAERQKQLQQLLAIYAGSVGSAPSGVGWY